LTGQEELTVSDELSGKVALITGASKNIGKGIALEVGASGATTYLTARSVEDVPGQLASLQRTAAEIEARGGKAIAVACDHTDDAQVEAVFDRIRAEQGRLDLVVNVASPDFSEMVGVSFWDLPFRHITACLEIGPRSDYVTTALAARMMVQQRSGVIVNISSHGAEGYLLSVPYGVGKAAIDKVTRDTAFELKPHGVAVVSLWPGLVLTEGLLANTVVTDDGRRELHGLDISFGETPKFNGRAVVALASDPDILERSGGSYWSASLAREYGFTEDDGHLPPEMANSILTAMGDDMPDYWRGVERAAPSEGA
jgi:NAD(P)-dependent dehydrogenase (short-subunit alcohol dehydrogenase family)